MPDKKSNLVVSELNSSQLKHLVTAPDMFFVPKEDPEIIFIESVEFYGNMIYLNHTCGLISVPASSILNKPVYKHDQAAFIFYIGTPTGYLFFSLAARPTPELIARRNLAGWKEK